jgi:uncharacterized small protein (DUF1192 family)
MEGVMQPFDKGDWVAYADYAALQAENERLRKFWKATSEGVNRYVGKSIELEDKLAALQAENERLRKAGDAMASQLYAFGYNSAWDFWNKAKGVQS